MKSSKQIYSTYFKEYEIDSEGIKALHDALLVMYIDIKSVCDKHGIKCMLSGGTLLGAIRHKGFIPWDDDIDIMMIREEYEKFVKVFPGEFADKYELVKPLSPGYFNKQPKIFKKGTTLVEIPYAGVHQHDNLFIDVFIIENCPKPGFKRNFRAFRYDFAFKASSACIDYKYPSPVILEKGKTCEEVKKYYKMRRRLGFIFSHIGGMKFYLTKCDKLGKYSKQTGWMAVPSAISYKREILPAKVFTELTEGEFEGLKVTIPSDYDTYLTNLYRDYMTIPPEDKRETHYACKMVL